MSFSSSGVFVQWPLACVNATATGRGAPTTASELKAALYNDTTTPDKTAAVGSTGYNTGVWVVANEQTSSTQWPAGGVALTTVTSSASSNVYKLDADDAAGSGNVTLSGVKGCLVYDDKVTGGTVAKQGICYNYFGGSQSVTSGTFTIVWNTSGIMTITV
jgi:hypothetical protein